MPHVMPPLFYWNCVFGVAVPNDAKAQRAADFDRARYKNLHIFHLKALVIELVHEHEV